MNKIIVSGNLVKNIEIQVSSKDTLIGRLTIACSEYYNGEQKTHFFNCVLFGSRVEKLEDYLLKGAKVLIDGKMIIDYNKQNQKTYTSIIIDNIEILKFIDPDKKEDENNKNNKNNKYNKYKK